jgi:glutamate-ammonia-ligase adenylyltransferase
MKPEDLLLAPELNPTKVQLFLKKYGFRDPEAVDRNLQLMSDDLTTRLILARIVRNLLESARKSPDPDSAVNYFERLLANVAHPGNFLGFLGDTPDALEALILLLGTSPFSAEILIRNPEYFYWILDELGAPWVKSAEVYLEEARRTVESFAGKEDRLRALARFKRREILRIGARDIAKATDVVGTITELSNLADAILESVYWVCFRSLVEKHGVPQYLDPTGSVKPARFTILAMGKLGGRELNYSSDIDLIYIYDGESGRSGPLQAADALVNSGIKTISNTEFFSKLAQSITHELSSLTEEGYFYRVDLRLPAKITIPAGVKPLNAWL